MKKYYLAFAAFAVAALISSAFVVFGECREDVKKFFSESIEALTGTESGSFVTCRCDDGWFFPNHRCSARNEGSVCAGGDNWMCTDYDTNCL